MGDVLFLSLVAAIISLDITALGQFMVSRPIVCAPFIGYLLGDVKTGLWVGMTIELIWIAAIPMGAAIPLETTAIAILSVVWGLNNHHPQDTGAVLIAMVLSVFAAMLFRWADVLVRYTNVKIMHWVEKGVAEGNDGRIRLGIYQGLGLFFVKSYILYAILIYPGAKIVDIFYHYLDVKSLEGLRLAWYILPILGMCLLLVKLRDGKFPCNRIEHMGRKSKAQS